MQVFQDTENRIALEQPRYFEVVADLEGNTELQEATRLLQNTREEEYHRRELVSVLQNRELTNEMAQSETEA
eukprot:4457970-Prorocentrum_lima.AAC.1